MLVLRKYFYIVLSACFALHAASDQPVKIVEGVLSIKNCWCQRISSDINTLAELVDFVSEPKLYSRDCVHHLDDIQKNARTWVALIRGITGLDIADNEVLVPVKVECEQDMPGIFPQKFPHSWLKGKREGEKFSLSAWGGSCQIKLRLQNAKASTNVPFDQALEKTVSDFVRFEVPHSCQDEEVQAAKEAEQRRKSEEEMAYILQALMGPDADKTIWGNK